MTASEEMVQEMKRLYKEERNEELSDEKAQEAAQNLIGLAELMYEIAMKEVQLKRRLKKEPAGFPVDGNYSCTVCGGSINEQNGWHSWYGNTCPLCRKAITDGVIPTFVCTDRESCFSMWKLTSDLKVRTPTILKYIREGRIKARIVLNNEGKSHTYIFLRKENPNLIQKNSPERKSYDRNKKKRDKIWSRIEAKKWKAEFFPKKKKPHRQ